MVYGQYSSEQVDKPVIVYVQYSSERAEKPIRLPIDESILIRIQINITCFLLSLQFHLYSLQFQLYVMDN
jgi:hypothetical protein